MDNLVEDLRETEIPEKKRKSGKRGARLGFKMVIAGALLGCLDFIIPLFIVKVVLTAMAMALLVAGVMVGNDLLEGKKKKPPKNPPPKSKQRKIIKIFSNGEELKHYQQN